MPGLLGRGRGSLPTHPRSQPRRSRITLCTRQTSRAPSCAARSVRARVPPGFQPAPGSCSKPTRARMPGMVQRGRRRALTRRQAGTADQPGSHLRQDALFRRAPLTTFQEAVDAGDDAPLAAPLPSLGGVRPSAGRAIPGHPGPTNAFAVASLALPAAASRLDRLSLLSESEGRGDQRPMRACHIFAVVPCRRHGRGTGQPTSTPVGSRRGSSLDTPQRERAFCQGGQSARRMVARKS